MTDNEIQEMIDKADRDSDGKTQKSSQLENLESRENYRQINVSCFLFLKFITSQLLNSIKNNHKTSD